ncbi:phenylalanyl-tRNA synthetase subunit alpha [Haloferula helveola]|uniref:Phenylalanyl-tRNA synthetase subunit alpha n=1 Tax=Haloferula helveola TaxID=490095 RepID=A0ABM7RHP0_9BACT|nr:phenylalanyl-tRNA synthetase subunit alpha [Haloferula helveola]
MTGLWILLGGVAAVVALVVWSASRKRRYRASLRAAGLSASESERVGEMFPLWRKVPDETRGLAAGWMRVFLDEKRFEACGGLAEVTADMKLAVAAPACLLIAHRPQDYYEKLRSILIYPDAYRDVSGEDVRLGESWGTGSVVLSWKSVIAGESNPEDGLNVVLHEFAHQLDQEDGAADGVPDFEDPLDYGRWSRAFAPAYEAFCERVNAGKRTVLDAYGGESPAEFFAVATETFFERPKALREEEPEIYEQLQRFYGMDPSGW